ncbi:MAG: hydroxyacid dehydrogenase, partial [Actinobacteria bacterium]|nr:hydroxyacid dehydrogenase [Actinomycetota bacterium]
MGAKIVFYEVEPWEDRYIRASMGREGVRDIDMTFIPDPLTAENVESAGDAEIISPFIYSEVNQSVLRQIPHLKFIATRSTGHEHIDLDECRGRGIVVSNVPTYGENTVAEHTFALILAIARKLLPSVERTRKGNFSLEGLMGFDLKGKKLGVVGAGHIGRNVIGIASGFKMNVLVFDPRRDEDLARGLGFRYVGLDELLLEADIITLHAPHNPRTHHIINRGNINKIKPGSVLVNTSRGGLVETDALVEALYRGVLSGAGLDVLEEEALIAEERQLLSHEFTQEGLRIALHTHRLL